MFLVSKCTFGWKRKPRGLGIIYKARIGFSSCDQISLYQQYPDVTVIDFTYNINNKWEFCVITYTVLVFSVSINNNQ